MNKIFIVTIKLLWATFLFVIGPANAQINSFEYFIDTDPGLGNATVITTGFTPGDTVGLILQVPINNSLDNGFHHLHIRSKNNNQWGHYVSQYFFVSGAVTNNEEIITAEYFFDTDPGIGNGNTLNIGNGDTLANTYIIPVPNNLTPGIHYVTIRVKNSKLYWSHYQTQLFFVSGSSSSAGLVNAIEYFFDSDPGVGNGTLLSFTAADTVTQLFNIPVTGLNPGFHQLNVRAKNDDGIWGHKFTQSFIVSAQVSGGKIAGAEYFIDIDPGNGNGTPIAVNPAVDTYTNNLTLPVPNNLSEGTHTMVIRVKNENNQWSLYDKIDFVVKHPKPGSGNALHFDGINDYASINKIDTLQDFTVEFWVKNSGTGGSSDRITSMINDRFEIYKNNNTLWFSSNSLGISSIDIAPLPLGLWNHFSFVRNGTNFKIFKNGAEVLDTTCNTTVLNYAWELGRRVDGGQYAQIDLDEFRIWNTALSQTEIRERMCRKIKIGDALYNNLLQYFNFDEANGSVFYDVERNVLGTINGATWVASGAAIGDLSAFDYSGASANASITHPTRNDSFAATLSSGNATGIQVYCVTDSANHINGTTCLDENEGYFGVFTVNDETATFSIDYDYTPFINSNLNEAGFKLYGRLQNDANTWSNTNAGVDTIQNLISINDTQRAEYILSSSVVAATIAISANPGNNICNNESVTFTANATNEGTSPIYQWRKNGINVGTNSYTYTDNSLANGDIITCKLISNSECVSPDSAISNAITMSVNNLPASVVISANPSNIICTGTQVNFTATPTNGGATPHFQWQVNGVNIGGNQPGLTLNNLANNDIVTCRLATSAACATPDTAISNSIAMNVTPTVLPTISIASNEGNVICAGTNVIYTANITNGGNNPIYQWKRNGQNVGFNSDTFSINTLNNNDIITCHLTSDANCATPTTVIATGITMTVNSTAAVSANIVANTGTTICIGSNVTFTANITNGGSSPVYQWKKNGNNVGTNSNTYTDSTLLHNDVISCFVTSSSSCANPDTVTSNTLTMNVLSYQSPTIVIAATQNDTICSGTNVVFTTNITNGGNNPSYTWLLNGNIISVATSATYSKNNLTNNDTISCLLKSNYTCLDTNDIVSNSIYKVVLPKPTADAGSDQTILQGGSTILTASGGDAYLWSTNDTTASIVVAPLSTSVYTVTAYNAEGCSDQDNVTVTVNFSSLSVSPSFYNFGNVVIDDTVYAYITVKNNGTLTDTITSAQATGVFGTTFTSQILAPTQSVQIPVHFVPQNTLIYQSPLIINTTAGTFSVVLNGKGVLAAPSWTINTLNYNYGNVGVNDSALHVFTIHNTGNVPILIDTIISNNSAFELLTAPQTIAVNGSGQLFVKFKPTSIQTYNGQLTITSINSSLSNLVLHLSGTGYMPGNPPVMQFSAAFPYNSTSGVDYPVAAPGTFNYSIVYKHPNGVPPQVGFPKVGIDMNADQDFADVGEGVFTMTKIGNGTDWINGETFIFSQALPIGNGYGYRFFAKDSLGNDAIQVNTNYIAGPLVTNQSLDLSIYANDISFSDNNPNVNQQFTVFAQIRNTSPYNASYVPVRFYNDSVFLAADTIPFIAANSNVTISRTMSFDVDGFYPIKVWIDSSGTLTENNVLNNYAIRPVIVGNFSVPGTILTTHNAVTSSCNITNVGISGIATYDGLNLQGNPPVLGATVTVAIDGGPTFNTYTVTGGNWSVGWSYFACGQTYNYTVTITDYTLTSAVYSGTFNAPCTTCTAPPQPSITHSGNIPYCVPLNSPTAYNISITPNCVSPSYFNDTTFVFVNNILVSTHVHDTLFPCNTLSLSDTFTFSIGNHTLAYQSVYYDSFGNRNVLNGSNNIVVSQNPDVYIGSFTKTSATSFTFRDWNGSYCVGAGQHTVYLYDSTTSSGQYQLVDSFVVNFIPGTQTVTPYVTLSYSNQSMEMGYHYLKIITDVHNNLTELNESNNEFNIVFYVPFPELTIGNIVMSSSNIVENSVVNFSATINNSGSGADTFQIQFYANDVPFGTPIQLDTLIANSSTSIVSGVYTIPADTCPITITAIVDVNNQVLELNEGNNKDSMYIAYDITSGVGCFGYGSACNPYIVVKDSLVNFQSIVSNVGTRDIQSTDTVDVTFTLGGVPIGYDNVIGGIPAKGSKNIGLYHSFSIVGSYQIFIHPDTGNAICELNETNNIGVIYISVVEGAADLEILSQHISPSNLNPQPNQSLSVAASIFNKGNQASKPTKVRFWVDDVQFGVDVDIDSIYPGQDTTVMATATYSAAIVGPKIIKVMADAPEIVTEIRENNNTATRAIIVGAAPDLASSLQEAITVSNPFARKGDVISISNYLRNYGGDSGTAWLKFFVTDNMNNTTLIDSVQFTLQPADSMQVSINWLVDFVGEGKITTEIAHCNPAEYNVFNNTDEMIFTAGPRLQLDTFFAVDTILCINDSLQIEGNFISDNQLLTFEWKHNGNTINNALDSIFNIQSITINDTGNYQLIITDSFGSIATSLILIQINHPINIVLQPDSLQNVCEGNIISLVAHAENVTGYQWQWNNVDINGATDSAYSDSLVKTAQSGNYTVVFTALPGCYDSVSTIAVVNVSEMDIELADSGTVDSFYHTAATVYNYSDNDCKRLASVSSGIYDLGKTIVTTKVDTTLEGYVSQYSDIHTTYNQAAIVTLYFKQEEFDRYNVWAMLNNKPLLPTSPNDTNVNKIIVEQYHGAPSVGTTGPGGQYDASNMDIIPNSFISVSWDTAKQYWILTFPVNGFSGFFVLSGEPVPLPIVLSDIKATNDGSANIIEWQTAKEDIGDYFALQRSVDGKNFTTIYNTEAKGNPSVYHYTDQYPYAGINYYRLQLLDVDNEFTYSKTVSALVTKGGALHLSVFPNPVTDIVKVTIAGGNRVNATITISAINGAVVLEQKVTKDELLLDMSKFSSGTYFIRYTDDTDSRVIKLTKK